MKRIVIVGAGGHGKVVADVVRAGDAFEVAAFADELATQRDGDLYLGVRVLAGADALERARALGIGYALVAFGDCKGRLGCCERLRANGFEIVSAIHPRAVVAPDVSIGAGTVVVAGAVIGCDARLGEAVIVNTSASVDHDCVLDDGVHVEPGAHLGGERARRPRDDNRHRRHRRQGAPHRRARARRRRRRRHPQSAPTGATACRHQHRRRRTRLEADDEAHRRRIGGQRDRLHRVGDTALERGRRARLEQSRPLRRAPTCRA